MSIAAKATKAGLTSDYSNSASITVDNALDLDPDFVRISSGGVDVSAGVVRAERNTLALRQLDIEAVLDCATQPNPVNLFVTENGLISYALPPVNLIDLGSNQWLVEFRLWLSDPHSTYDVWLEWTCGGVDYRENLLFILIDPDGYVYDQSLVDGGATITDSIVLNAVVTAFVKVNDVWQVWPAHVYGQTNPQNTDGTTGDGVMEPGYYSFLTPPGQYRIEVLAEGFQPYQSPVLTVISDPIHLDIGLDPISGGNNQIQAPVDLARSGKWVDQAEAWLGDVLTYDVWLFNDGDVGTGVFTVTDVVPDHAVYVAGSLVLEEGPGAVAYDDVGETMVWTGAMTGQTAVHYSYWLLVNNTPGSPFDLTNVAATEGEVVDLFTLPDLTAVTHIQNVVDINLESDQAANGDPGETMTYQHTITNNGNFTDTFTFSAVSSAGWPVMAPAAVELAPDASQQVTVEVSIPGSALYGTMDNTVLTAASEANENLITAVTDQTTVNRVVALSLSSSTEQTGEPGTTVTYTHQLQNLGNGSDTFTITAVSDQGWSVSHSGNPTVAANGSTTIEVYVTIPADVRQKRSIQRR